MIKYIILCIILILTLTGYENNIDLEQQATENTKISEFFIASKLQIVFLLKQS